MNKEKDNDTYREPTEDEWHEAINGSKINNTYPTSKKFVNVPYDKYTKILFNLETKLDEYDVLYQKWFWDGITAESIIFLNDDVSDKSNDDLEALVKTSPLVNEDSSFTVKKTSSGYAFVNFNFVTE